MLGLALCFVVPLWGLIRFAAGSELYSYILLIPFISLYLVWLNRQKLPPVSRPCRGIAAGFLTVGTIVLAAYWLGFRSRLKLIEDDYLAVMMISFLLLFFGVCAFFIGRDSLRTNIFALGFLVFLVPIPTAAVQWIDALLQAGSATVAHCFFTLSGTPFLRSGLFFKLPGITIEIGPECSGIHSSLVLFITSLVAGYLFLRTPGRRTVFVLAVIPLAVLRNGFRVFTIGELCVHIGPEMINSPIHRRGGPLFFVLSLIPLLLLLVLLQRSERANVKSKPETGELRNSAPPE